MKFFTLIQGFLQIRGYDDEEFFIGEKNRLPEKEHEWLRLLLPAVRLVRVRSSSNCSYLALSALVMHPSISLSQMQIERTVCSY